MSSARGGTFTFTIYSNSVTLKSRLEATQGHWKWDRSIDRNSVPYYHMALSCIVWVVDQKSRSFYTPHLCLSPAGDYAVGISRRLKPEWLGYRVVKKLWRYVKPFWYNTGMWRTDRQTHRIPISMLHIAHQQCWLLMCLTVIGCNCKNML